MFLGHNDTLNQEVVEREKHVAEKEFDFYSNSTINLGIAAAIYKAFEQLSYLKNTNDAYHIILELLHGMMYQEKFTEGYRTVFEKRLWEQIGANVVGRYYPTVLRVYLEFIGFCLVADRSQRQGWIGKQAERMRRVLYVDLKPLMDSGAEMIDKEKMKDALLPSSMTYKNGKFVYKLKFGRGEEKEIDPVEKGSASALEGVDFEHRSLV